MRFKTSVGSQNNVRTAILTVIIFCFSTEPSSPTCKPSVHTRGSFCSKSLFDKTSFSTLKSPFRYGMTLTCCNIFLQANTVFQCTLALTKNFLSSNFRSKRNKMFVILISRKVSGSKVCFCSKFSIRKFSRFF